MSTSTATEIIKVTRTFYYMAKVKNIKLHNPIEVHFDVISRYHYFLFALLFLSKVPVFWHVLSLLFLAPPMDFYCNATETTSDSSKNFCPCEQPWWDRSVFTETMQTKYGTHCERNWLIGLSHSMLYLGSLLGSLMFGFLSDKFGRLSIFSLSLFIMATFGSITIVMPTIASYTFIRFLEGLGVGGAVVTGYVLCVEYCGVRHREVVTALFHVPLNIGHMTLAGISYLLRDCDDFQLAISIPLFLFVGLKWCLLESPKWLMDSDQVDKAALVMEKVSQFNRTSFGSIKAEIEEYHANYAKTARRKLQLWHIFQHRRLTINFVCMAAIYFVCGMGYYGVSQYIGQMIGDIHVNVALSGALLLPGTVAATFLLHILSRRTFLMATNFLSGGLMLVVVLLPPDQAWVRVILACVCNSSFFVSFMIVFLYGVELFPTSVRNSVLGVLTVMSRAGQMAAPPINNLPESTSGAIFGGLAILGGVLCIPLPETKNTELPSSLEDSKKLRRKTLTYEENVSTGINIAT